MRELASSLIRARNILLVIMVGYAVVAVLSLIPEVMRPHLPGVSDKVEHVVAYSLLGFFTAALLGRMIALPIIFGVVVAYAGVLEVVQTLVPCRSASLKDLAASSVGALIGVTVAGVLKPLRT